MLVVSSVKLTRGTFISLLLWHAQPTKTRIIERTPRQPHRINTTILRSLSSTKSVAPLVGAPVGPKVVCETVIGLTEFDIPSVTKALESAWDISSLSDRAPGEGAAVVICDTIAAADATTVAVPESAYEYERRVVTGSMLTSNTRSMVMYQSSNCDLYAALAASCCAAVSSCENETSAAMTTIDLSIVGAGVGVAVTHQASLGVLVGAFDGALVGALLGTAVGACVGAFVGRLVSPGLVGVLDGVLVGALVGPLVGPLVGAPLGALVGA